MFPSRLAVKGNIMQDPPCSDREFEKVLVLVFLGACSCLTYVAIHLENGNWPYHSHFKVASLECCKLRVTQNSSFCVKNNINRSFKTSGAKHVVAPLQRPRG